MARTNASLVTQTGVAQQTTVVQMVSGGTAAERPANPPLYFIYTNTTSGVTEVFRGPSLGWLPLGSQGLQGPQGYQGSAGPSTIYDFSLTGGLNGGFIRFTNALQFTWFEDSERTQSTNYTRAMPTTVGTVLQVYADFRAPGVTTGENQYIELMSWTDTVINYFIQQVTSSGSFPAVTPTFFVVSNRPVAT
jgi:hypothetical protein